MRAIRASIDLRQLAPGSVVALSADATVAGVATLLALIVADVVAAPLNVRLTARELTEYLDRIQPALLISDPSHTAATLGRDWLDLGWPELDWPGLDRTDLDEVGRSAPPSIDTAQPVMSDPCIAFPTGGTTGLPKAALWTQEGLALAIGSSVDNLVVDADDTELYISPIFHVTIVPGFLATLAAGGTVVLQPRFDAAAAAEAIESGQITRMFGTPTAVGRIFDHMHGPQPDNRMQLIYGAARSSDPFRARVREMLPRASVYSGYGATEVGAVVRLKPEHGGGDRGVGRPVAGVRITILDPDRQSVPTGERGDVAVFSPFACIGYLGAETTGPQRLADGSVITGDVGWLDEDGFLHLDGRRTEMIKTGGENVFPAEVEAVLLSHPAVRDAAVFGVVDPEWGEQVRALVVLDARRLDSEGSMTCLRSDRLLSRAPGRVQGSEADRLHRRSSDDSLVEDRPQRAGHVGLAVLTLETDGRADRLRVVGDGRSDQATTTAGLDARRRLAHAR